MRFSWRNPVAQALYVASLCWAACASAPVHKSLVVPIPRGTPIRVVAFYPFGFRWPEPAYRSFELSQHLIVRALASEASKVMFLGPAEFHVYHYDDDRAWASTDIVSVLPSLRIRPEEAIVVRPWAERLVMSSHQEAATASGKQVKNVSVEEVTLRVHVELLHPSSETRIGEFVSEQRLDPFAAHGEEDADPSPELTRMAETLTGEALASVEGNLQRPFAPHELGFTYRFNPEVALAFHDETRPALTEELLKKDPLEGELLRLNRIRYANPGLSDADATRMTHLPGGLVVETVTGHVRLEPGDVISTINGKPALPQSLERVRYATSPVNLRVRRASGDWVETTLP